MCQQVGKVSRHIQQYPIVVYITVYTSLSTNKVYYKYHKFFKIKILMILIFLFLDTQAEQHHLGCNTATCHRFLSGKNVHPTVSKHSEKEIQNIIKNLNIVSLHTVTSIFKGDALKKFQHVTNYKQKNTGNQKLKNSNQTPMK